VTVAANDLLKATSRSFYLTLRVLPRGVRHQIGLAYLLARTTDTVADTEIVPVARRLEALRELRDSILGVTAGRLDLGELARKQNVPAEVLLLENAHASITELAALSPPDRELLRNVLATIISGQELDLQRFAGATADNITALPTGAELDDYTFRVAGCVGEFWTKLCRAHLFPHANLDDGALLANGVRFGKGLQLVNILRDLPADLKNGRCYLPQDRLTAAGLTPQTLLNPENEAAFLRLFAPYLAMAEAHLAAGWRYVNQLPFAQFRVRLACAWPLLLGVRTVEQLRAARVADLKARVKVPRSEVYAMMVRSTLAAPVPVLWRQLYHPPAKAVASEGDLA
jgi:farnesyl-diphosphate farnesyltransferase